MIKRLFPTKRYASKGHRELLKYQCGNCDLNFFLMKDGEEIDAMSPSNPTWEEEDLCCPRCGTKGPTFDGVKFFRRS